MKSIDDLEVSGRRVLLRADLNVPLDLADPENPRITDDGRIRASLPTIRKLSDQGARVVICAHLGRPKGTDYAERAAGGPSLRPVAERLGELLGRPVAFAADVAGEDAARVVAGLADSGVALLENVRYEPAETSKDDAERGAFAARLAEFGDVYVGDGFGAVHRKHASVYDVPRLLPHAAGYLVRDEVEVLSKLTSAPERPYVVVLGGAKPSDKLAVISNLLDRADRVLIGGGMSYTFLAAQGYEVGNSLLEADQIPQVTQIMADAERRGVELVLPVDLVAATRFAPDAEHDVVGVKDFPADREGVDIGRPPASCSPRSWPTRRPCSGTARSGCSNSPRSRPAPAPSPRPSSGSTGSRWWAGATRLPPSGPSACRRTRSVTSPRAAEPAWSTWKGARCPAWSRWRPTARLSTRSFARDRRRERETPDGAQARAAADGRQLEDERQPPRGHRAGPEAGVHPDR